MKYAFKNLSVFIRKEKIVFAMMVVSVFFSALLLNFSYGVYRNYHTKTAEAEINNTMLRPRIVDGQTLTKKDLQTYSEALSPELLDAMEVICAETVPADGPGAEMGGTFKMRYRMLNGKYDISWQREAYKKTRQIKSGRFISDEEEENGAFVAVLSDDDSIFPHDAETISLFGNEYQVIGMYRGDSSYPIVPFLSLPDSLPFTSLLIVFYENVTQKQYRELVKTADSVIPGILIYDEPDFPDEDSMYIYRNIMLISVLISLVSAVNFAMLYLYMVKKRSRDLAIFRICGCTRSKAIRLYVTECLLISVPVYLLGVLLYITVLQKRLSAIYEHMNEVYTPLAYLAIFAVYLLTVFLITEIVVRRKIAGTVMSSLNGGVR